MQIEWKLGKTKWTKSTLNNKRCKTMNNTKALNAKFAMEGESQTFLKLIYVPC